MPIDLATAQFSDFENLTGQVFNLSVPELQLPLVLISVTQLRPLPPGLPRAHGFSLIFRGPLEPQLTQGCCHLENPQIGLLQDVFIVPVGQDAEGLLYQVVFN